MKTFILTKILLLTTLLIISGCSNTPLIEPQDDRAEIQKLKAKQAQQELASEIKKAD